jgi:PAS domain S-box-containing protein
VADKRTRSARIARLAPVLVELSPDALIGLSPDGEVLSWNHAAHAMFGYTSAEAVGRLIYDLVIPADRQPEARHDLPRDRDLLVRVGTASQGR